MSLSVVLMLSGAAGVATAAALIATRSLHARATCDWLDGAQKVHTRPAPRVGGLVLLAACAAGGWVLGGLCAALTLAALPAFAAGLAEDVTGRISPRLRLAATLVAGLATVLLTGNAVTGIGVPGLDAVLTVPLAAALFTAFAVAGAAHAVNLVDGFHGLAAGTVLIALSAIGGAAWLAGDAPLLATCGIVAAGLAAFLIFNFPHGRIFLGDAGAYLAGTMLGALAVALVARNPDVPPMAALVALAYPVTETLASIARRWLAGRSPGEADGGHLHSLLHRQVTAIIAHDAGAGELGNPLTSVLLWPLSLMAGGIAVSGVLMPAILPGGLAVITGFYLLAYLRLAGIPVLVPLRRRLAPAQ